MTRTIAIALGLLLATSSFAGEKSGEPAASLAPTDAAACTDETAAQAKKAKEKEAMLAELARRLDAEPKVDGDFRVLYPSGHNYDMNSTVPSPIQAPPASAAPESAKPDAKSR